MIINKMDDILMQIYSIKDIEEILFTELVPASNDDRLEIMPCIYVRYDSGKVLNLCSADKYFDIFIKKVYEVYQEEKDKVVTNPDLTPFRVSKLVIDDKAKSLLESGSLINVNDLYKFYEGKKSYDYNLLIQKDEFESLLPLLIYHIKELYDKTDINLTFDDLRINGYRNNYTINIKINGIDDILYINYKKDNEYMYTFNIRSNNNEFENTTVYVYFKKNGISITSSINKFNLDDENDYLIINDKLNHIRKVTRNNLPLIYTNELAKPCENQYKDITSIDGEDNMTWYLLPWNAIYGIDNKHEKLSDDESIDEIHNKYFSTYLDNFIIREYMAKSFHKSKTFDTSSYDIVLEEAIKKLSGIKLFDNDSIYLIETNFFDHLKDSGYYKTYLNGKYFYHLVDKSKGFDKSNLVSISQDNNIIYGADVLVKNDVLKLVRGE